MIRQVGKEEIEQVRRMSITTYTDTFGSQNTKEDLAEYLDTAFDPTSFEKEIQHPDSFFYFYVTEDNQLAGYLKANIDSAQTEEMGAEFLEIQRIYILSEYKGRGYGSALLSFAESKARQQGKTKTWLGVWEKNAPALRFYEKQGYRKYSSHSFFMGMDEQTDYILTKNIENGE